MNFHSTISIYNTLQLCFCVYTAISIKVVHEQSGKVEYERERLLGIPKKLMNFHSDSRSLSRLYSTFPLCSGTTLIEIAVYLRLEHAFYFS
jgi:hypothetical protein